MKTFITALLFGCMASAVCHSQVQPSYQYNTSMPYGTLDIRTRISSENYYYLKEGETFAFRERTPGVRTKKYLDMTAWGDSNPYRQGHLRQKNGSSDKFVMNYRVLFPANYDTTYEEGYPLLVLLHGAGERGNCFYNTCHHDTPAYDPNTNSPPAPSDSTHKLLNNDNHLQHGGRQHLEARNLAGNKLPNNPTLPARAFPGFVLAAQMLNVWDSLNIQDVIRIVLLHCKKYKIDQNRIYVYGLSIGGYGTYEAMMRAPWLFAAALPMSAVRENIFEYNQQNKVAHIPVWTFQGGTDKAPTVSYTDSLVANFRKAGADIRYTLYSHLSHAVWNRAYGEPEFYSWMLSKSKTNVHVHGGNKVIVKNKNQYPLLLLAEGFLAYQWEKNGVVIAAAKSNTFTATEPGIYRARFSRISSAPTASQWNKWSAPVTITETTPAEPDEPDEPEEEPEPEEPDEQPEEPEEPEEEPEEPDEPEEQPEEPDEPEEQPEEPDGTEEPDEPEEQPEQPEEPAQPQTPEIPVVETPIVGILDNVSNGELFSISIYPNPADADNINLKISTASPNAVLIEMVDPMGRKLYAKTFEGPALERDVILTLPELSEGIYLVFATQGQSIVKKRIIIKN